jgi:5S rRNA maturation endonuclease (ribonuclease M5)
MYINGVFRPEGAFRSRTEALEALNLKQASEVWIFFTPDFSGQEVKDILKYFPENTKVYYFSGPLTAANFGRKTVELMCLR